MGAEEDAGAAVERGEACDEVGSAGFDFFEGDGCTEGFEPAGEEVGDFGFAGVRGAGGGVWVDGGDADEVLEK